MSDPLLPPGIRISPCVDTEERRAVRIDLSATTAQGIEISAYLVMTPRQMRAFCALGLKQLDLMEEAERARGPLLRVLP